MNGCPYIASVRFSFWTLPGWRFATAADQQDLKERLRREEAEVAIASEKLLDAAGRRFRELRMELPAELELQRLVNAALNGYLHDL